MSPKSLATICMVISRSKVLKTPECRSIRSFPISDAKARQGGFGATFGRKPIHQTQAHVVSPKCWPCPADWLAGSGHPLMLAYSANGQEEIQSFEDSREHGSSRSFPISDAKARQGGFGATFGRKPIHQTQAHLLSPKCWPIQPLGKKRSKVLKTLERVGIAGVFQSLMPMPAKVDSWALKCSIIVYSGWSTTKSDFSGRVSFGLQISNFVLIYINP